MNLVLQFLPAVSWVVAILWCAMVGWKAIRKGALYFKKQSTEPLFLNTWQVASQLISVVLACVPYASYKVLYEGLPNYARSWYTTVSIPSMIPLGLMLFVEVVLLVMQAHMADISRR
jgi:magnesium-transporting ATPase (P-type)